MTRELFLILGRGPLVSAVYRGVSTTFARFTGWSGGQDALTRCLRDRTLVYLADVVTALDVAIDAVITEARLAD